MYKILYISYTTKEFWLKYRDLLPSLFKIFKYYFGILAANSIIACYFSIPVAFNDKRRSYMSDDLLISIDLLKANRFVLNYYKRQ